ncbi:hypothetical protein ALQ77_01493 [Pseudomonas corrugata]|uniref:Uncharacterized protein n=2 Tax=Pseudomonas TaxID=286 RepID=A0A3M3E8N4_9PSED|nr:hypothetical protein ALQ77_01493 [Pseudomonas corrugata]
MTSTDALRSALEGTQSVPGCVPTRSVGTISALPNIAIIEGDLLVVAVPINSMLKMGLKCFNPFSADIKPAIVYVAREGDFKQFNDGAVFAEVAGWFFPFSQS